MRRGWNRFTINSGEKMEATTDFYFDRDLIMNIREHATSEHQFVTACISKLDQENWDQLRPIEINCMDYLLVRDGIPGEESWFYDLAARMSRKKINSESKDWNIRWFEKIEAMEEGIRVYFNPNLAKYLLPKLRKKTA